mmetsp:Transcript_98819/g.247734  ORF Transcript_98819/g.247734 Transcript_98819/m.247734 type:complete len:501 (-) Transcript_98819:325-1827(-)
MVGIFPILISLVLGTIHGSGTWVDGKMEENETELQARSMQEQWSPLGFCSERCPIEGSESCVDFLGNVMCIKKVCEAKLCFDSICKKHTMHDIAAALTTHYSPGLDVKAAAPSRTTCCSSAQNQYGFVEHELDNVDIKGGWYDTCVAQPPLCSADNCTSALASEWGKLIHGINEKEPPHCSFDTQTKTIKCHYESECRGGQPIPVDMDYSYGIATYECSKCPKTYLQAHCCKQCESLTSQMVGKDIVICEGCAIFANQGFPDNLCTVDESRATVRCHYEESCEVGVSRTTPFKLHTQCNIYNCSTCVGEGALYAQCCDKCLRLSNKVGDGKTNVCVGCGESKQVGLKTLMELSPQPGTVCGGPGNAKPCIDCMHDENPVPCVQESRVLQQVEIEAMPMDRRRALNLPMSLSLPQKQSAADAKADTIDLRLHDIIQGRTLCLVSLAVLAVVPGCIFFCLCPFRDAACCAAHSYQVVPMEDPPVEPLFRTRGRQSGTVSRNS